VGTAEWTGVPLVELLRRAGVSEGAVSLVLEGADRGQPEKQPKPEGEITFARSLPLKKADEPDVLLAYQMNGRDLTPEHGFPVRAIVPGYYGMASVKWLTHIEVIREPLDGYWETTEYAYWNREGIIPRLSPLRGMLLKSAIARPRNEERIAANTIYRVIGAAWSGTSDVIEVDFSSDGGETWNRATMCDSVKRYVWRRWTYEWRTPSEPGWYRLRARAADSEGRKQPDGHDANYGNYGIHHTLPVDVLVETL
jgi:DMSO/TMAO reductase YedYZ molybdopterin-dependent catalytic subunit